MAKSFLSGQNSKKKSTGVKLPWKKIAIVAGVLVVAFGLGVGAFLLQNGLPQEYSGGQDDNSSSANEKPEGAIEESIAKSLDGDYDGAQKQLESEINDTSDNDKERKYDLYLQQSVNAYNESKYQASLDYAKKALSYVESYQAYEAAAMAAEGFGDNSTAKTYYQKALEAFPKDSPLYEVESERLKDAIEKVGQ